MTVAGGIERRELATFTVADLAWAVAAGIFVLLRLGPVWQAPVGGAELDHLSGAWQASIGVPPALSFSRNVTRKWNVQSTEIPIAMLPVIIMPMSTGAPL